MSVGVILYNDEHGINDQFSATDAQKLRNCCKLVENILEEREMNDGGNSEAIKIAIYMDRFGPQEYILAMNYIKHHNYDLPTYGKCISSNMENNVKDPEDVKLVCQNGYEGINGI